MACHIGVGKVCCKFASNNKKMNYPNNNNYEMRVIFTPVQVQVFAEYNKILWTHKTYTQNIA